MVNIPPIDGDMGMVFDCFTHITMNHLTEIMIQQGIHMDSRILGTIYGVFDIRIIRGMGWFANMVSHMLGPLFEKIHQHHGAYGIYWYRSSIIQQSLCRQGHKDDQQL